MQALQLALPVACTPGNDCFIQNYVDQADGNAYHDFLCRPLSYDKHKGTDFRVPTMAQADVAVLAAASGTVTGVRNDQQDIHIARIGKQAIAGRECGNGVVLRHADGWETQYCHLAKGSISVEVGQTVTQGDVLGRIGLSGHTEFPHLHLSVRNAEGTPIDPFNAAAMEGGCNVDTSLDTSLWNSSARSMLTMAESGYLLSGVADTAVKVEDVIEGKHSTNTLDADSPAIVLWTLLYGLQAEDDLSMAILNPDKSVAVQHSQTIPKFKAQFMQFIGKKRSGPLSWEAGQYEGLITVKRAGKAFINETFLFEIK